MPESRDQMKKTLDLELHGKKHYTVELNGSRLSEEFAEAAPFTSSLSEYAGSHYWGTIPHRLSTPAELKTWRPQKGSLYYADHLTAIAVYFGDPGSIAPYVVYQLGDVLEDISGLRHAGARITVSVS
jgi:hypothetical protein